MPVSKNLSDRSSSKSRRSESVSRRRSTDGQYDGPPGAPGSAPLKHRPKVFDNPPSFAGRRDASRKRYF